MKTQAITLIAVTYAAVCRKINLPMTRQRKRIAETLFMVAALCLFCLPPVTAAPGSWTQKADMSAPTTTSAFCVVDGILYVIGGCYPVQPVQKVCATVWAYDPKTDLWTSKAELPVERFFAGGAAVDGIIYVFAGAKMGVTLRPVVAYDPKTDTWVTKANIPTERNTPAVCAVGGIIYVIGGFTGKSEILETVEAYDPKTDQWTRKRNVPKPMYFATASVVDGVIYLFWETYTFAYDPKTDRWTYKARFSPDSFGLRSAEVDGIIYVFGGFSRTDLMPGLDFVLAYDPVQDRFTSRRKMPRTRAASACAAIDGKIYLAGGVDKEPIVNSDAVFWRALDVFDPQGGVTPQILRATLETSNSFRLAWQGESGIKYRVESTPDLTNRWTLVTLPTGTTVIATNALVETSCPVVPGSQRGFYRVSEAP